MKTALLVLLCASAALADSTGKVKLCDKTNQSNCAAVNSSGQVSIGGTINATSATHNTAAAPSYTEGTDNAFSADLAGSLRVICMGGTCGGASPFSDNAAFTAGTTSVSVVAGVFNDSITALTSGSAGAPRLTSKRAIHFNMRDASGNEIPFPAALAASGGFKVDVQNASIAVTGTFWQATQPVSIAATVNVSDQHSNVTTDYDTGAGTQTMTMYGLALPASGGSVAGGTATNPIRTDPTGTTTQPVSGTVTANAGTGTFATSSTQLPAALDGSGFLKVHEQGTATVSGTVAATQSGSWSLAANQSVNVAQINGVTPLMGNGVTGTGSPRVTIASDNTAFTVNAAQSGTWTVQPGNTQNTTAWLVAEQATTAGGLSISRTLAAASTNSTNVKGSAGQIYGWYISNISTTAKFVKFYNKATAPTCGTDTPVVTLLIPAQGTASLGAGSNVSFGPGIAFATGIGLCITGAVADNDTTAVTANDVVVNLFYK